MVTHKDLESDCKRIAREIMKDANNPVGDAACFGTVIVCVSKALAMAYAADKKAYVRKINKYIKGCSIKSRITNNYFENGEYNIAFDVEFDEVDAETEDW